VISKIILFIVKTIFKKPKEEVNSYSI